MHKLICSLQEHRSARPEVRRTAHLDGGAYLPFFCSLIRPQDYHHSGLRTDGQGRTERVLERGRYVRTILHTVCGVGGGVRRVRAPYDHLIRPPTRTTTG